MPDPKPIIISASPYAINSYKYEKLVDLYSSGNSCEIWPVTSRRKVIRNGVTHYCTTYTSTVPGSEAERVVIEIHSNLCKLDVNVFLNPDIKHGRLRELIENCIGRSLIAGEYLVQFKDFEHSDYEFLSQVLRYRLDIGMGYFHNETTRTISELKTVFDSLPSGVLRRVEGLLFSKKSYNSGQSLRIFGLPLAEEAKKSKNEPVPVASALLPCDQKKPVGDIKANLRLYF